MLPRRLLILCALAAACVLAVPAAASATTKFFHTANGKTECQITWTHSSRLAYCQYDSPGSSATLTGSGKLSVCNGSKCLGNGPEDATSFGSRRVR